MKYIQNRTNWCWVAACKVAGEQYKKNFTEFAFTLESPETEVAVSNLDGLRTDIVKRRNGIYFVDARLKVCCAGDCESNLIQTITLGTYESVHLPETKDHVVTE